MVTPMLKQRTVSMPILRLYSPELPLNQKRRIARELTDMLVHVLDLSEYQRHYCMIYFISMGLEEIAVGGKLLCDTRGYEYYLDIYERDLTLSKKQLLLEECTSLLRHLLNLSSENLSKIHILFHEYKSEDFAIGEKFLNQVEEDSCFTDK